MAPRNISRIKIQRQCEDWPLFEIEVTISTTLSDIPLYAPGNRIYLRGRQSSD